MNEKITNQISTADALNASTNPLDVGKVQKDGQGGFTQMVIGEKVTLEMNPQTGKVLSVDKTDSDLVEALKNAKELSK